MSHYREHKNAIFNLELEAEETLGLEPSCRGMNGRRVLVDAQMALDLCADAEKLYQLERLLIVAVSASADGCGAGAAAMEREATKKDDL